MATLRYHIRNEYGLGRSELYGAADRDDPDAILECVAVAGLVGLLRQLGDLADFSAEVFDELHEEVMNITSRGHKLMLRVQHLEKEVSTIGKGFFPQRFSYREGIDWHCNLQKGNDLVSTGDMPRSVMNAYRSCRGPPQLFKLDKFDVSGNGTCLKRYTDPSFYSMELASRVERQEAQEEKRASKVKKIVSFSANHESAESLSFRLLPCTTDQVFDKPSRHVRLKSRQFNESIVHTLRNYMENGIILHSMEEKHFPKKPASQSTMIKPGDSKADETIADASSNIDKGSTSAPSKQETATVCKIEMSDLNEENAITIKNANKTKGYYSNHQSVNKVGQNGTLGDDKGRPEHSPDCYISDAISSESGNFMDAHTAMESEIEADDEEQVRSDFLGIQSEESDFDTDEEEEELKAQYSEQYLHENSTLSPGFCTIFRKGTENSYFSDTLGHLAVQLLEENKNDSCVPPNSDARPSENSGIASIAPAFAASGQISSSSTKDSMAIPSGSVDINWIPSSSEKISDQALSHLYGGLAYVQDSYEIPDEENCKAVTQGTAETLSEPLNDHKHIELNMESMVNATDTTVHSQEPCEIALERGDNYEETLHASSSTNSVKLQVSEKEDQEPLNISSMNSNETTLDVILQNTVQTFEEAVRNESNSEPHSASFLQAIPSAVQFVEDLVDKNFAESSEKGGPLGSKPTNVLPSKNTNEHIIISEPSGVDRTKLHVEGHQNLILLDTNGEDLEPSGRTSASENELHDDALNSQEVNPHNIANDENHSEFDMSKIGQQLEIASNLPHSDKDGSIEGKKDIPKIAQLSPLPWRLTEPPALPIFEKEFSQVSRGIYVPPTVEESEIHDTLNSSRKTMDEALMPSLEEDKQVHDKDISISSSDLTYPSTLLEVIPSVDERPQNGVANFDRVPTPFLLASAKEDEKLNQVHEIMNTKLPPVSPLPMERPKRSGHVSLSLEQKTSSIFHDSTTLTPESENPTRKAHSAIIRPNDPLIESIASHDKSKLHKVPDLIRASAMPNHEERGSFLEQIKNKSFSLKPTAVPTMKFKGGPPTNLKVIAILEKANAIRQACAGSDEDDDDGNDSWSDS
ncbi:uncharacterized protein LOC141828578 [Curcuma longa]|uniref:uncharacterized protein LOC141828578 n=1 Tax=Curcuma longa TaxID=136217 RepID=UPI003D9EEBDE